MRSYSKKHCVEQLESRLVPSSVQWMEFNGPLYTADTMPYRPTWVLDTLPVEGNVTKATVSGAFESLSGPSTAGVDLFLDGIQVASFTPGAPVQWSNTYVNAALLSCFADGQATLTIVQTTPGEVHVGITTLETRADAELAAGTMAWTTASPGLEFHYDAYGVVPGTVAQLYWASGPSSAEFIGSPALTYQVENGGMTGVITGAVLQHAPANAAYLIMVLDPSGATQETNEANNLMVVQDVQITWSGYSQVLDTRLENAIKEGLRASGQATLELTGGAAADYSAKVDSILTTINENGVAAAKHLYTDSLSKQLIRVYEAAERDYNRAYAAYERALRKDPSATPPTVPAYAMLLTAAANGQSNGCVSITINPSSLANIGAFHTALASNPDVSKLIDPFSPNYAGVFYIEVG